MKGLIASACLLMFVQAGSDVAAAQAAAGPGDADRQAAIKAYQDGIRQLNWIKGPQHMELFDKAEIDVPDGYMFLNPADTEKFNALNQNLGGAKEYLIAPGDMHWFALFHFSDDGYVKDDEKIDAPSLLASITKSTEEGNKLRREKGWGEMTVVGWQTPPHYDSDTKRLEWAIQARDAGGSTIVNFNTRILGREGVTSAVLVADPGQLDPAIGEFKAALRGYEYRPGQRYAEYRQGDKIAAYGLAALVTGGAAAVAVKTGFWKVIVTALVAGWKFIVAGVVALFGGISKFLKRKNS